MIRYIGYFMAVLLLWLSGCNASSEGKFPDGAVFPTPTLYGLFVEDESNIMATQAAANLFDTTPTVAGFFTKHPSPTPKPSNTPSNNAVYAIPALPASETITRTIYADSFENNWELSRDNTIDVNIRSTDVTHGGRYSIMVTPKQGLSQINFVVSQDATETYPQDKVLGLRFWINPGDGYLEPSDLAVTVLGSDMVPYYVEGDNSVANIYDPVFSETRLYFLGFNRSVPPYTWAEVILWLDDLIYDPYYDYVVGFYLKNDEEYLGTFYVDDVKMLILVEQ